MAAGNFEKCHAVTAKWEGGWSDHPADPGGKTMYGITEAVYHAWLKSQGKAKRSVRYITKAEAKKIFRANYWDAVNAERLAPGVDLATYDAAVNSGPGRAKQWLMASIGGPDEQTVKNICKKRLSFVQGLSTWKTFGKGWLNRITDIEATGVKWALEAKGKSQAEVKRELDKEAQSAAKKSTAQAGGGVAAGGSSAVSPEMADQVAGSVLAGLIFVGVVIAAFLIFRAVVNKRREKAYREAAA